VDAALKKKKTKKKKKKRRRRRRGSVMASGHDGHFYHQVSFYFNEGIKSNRLHSGAEIWAIPYLFWLLP